MNQFLETKILDSNLAFFGIPASFLMENAGKGIAKEIEKRFGDNKTIWVFAGTGNNGGDAFVAARYLSKKNSISVFLAGKESEIKTKEAKENFGKIKKIKKIKISEISSPPKIPIPIDCDIILLGLFGVGLQGKIREPHKSILNAVYFSNAKIVAIDVSPPNFNPFGKSFIKNRKFKPFRKSFIKNRKFKTDLTISLHTKKEKGAIVVPIGIPKKLGQLCGPGDVKFLSKRNENSHKGENGIVTIIAGSKQYHGAAIYAGITASRLVDLVYFATPKENIPFVKKASPEFIVSEFYFSNAKSFIEKSDSVLIGPGLERSKSNKKLIKRIISNFKNKTFVLDAGALHLLSPKDLPPNCIVTPHASEFRALFGIEPNEKNVLEMAKKFNCIVVLKRKIDLISDGKKLWKCSGGNAMLTGGGTGDVLAGLIVAFSTKNSLVHSARAACFLNKFAAELLSKEKGLMWNAKDLMDFLPNAKKEIDEMT